MKEPKIDVCSLAQSNLDAAFDLPSAVLHATIPIQLPDLLAQLGNTKSVQFVSTEDGIFMIAWKEDARFDLFSLNWTPVPVKF